MRALGFRPQWIQLVMLCVRTVKFKVVLGGDSVGPIIPERGLRQGCPLSPYLFIIDAEGFSSLIRRYDGRGLIHGCRITQAAFSISHLFFVDDSYLFFRASASECEAIMELLDKYNTASSQTVDFQKSTICARLNVIEENDQAKYLGMPIMVAGTKN